MLPQSLSSFVCVLRNNNMIVVKGTRDSSQKIMFVFSHRSKPTVAGASENLGETPGSVVPRAACSVVTGQLPGRAPKAVVCSAAFRGRRASGCSSSLALFSF